MRKRFEVPLPRNRTLVLGERTLVMGIINVTPDSFADGGLRFDASRAVDDGWQMLEDGADILDIGGESTRPGAEPLGAAEELRRTLPVIEGFAGRPIYTFETGGSTGVPKSRINIDDFRIDYEAFSDTLPEEFFPRGTDWLSLGPTGPRRLRLAVEHLAQHRGGICFMVDLDPRWVIKLIKMGQPKMAEQYKQHVVEQGLTLLKAHDGIRCLFTTPKLLEALCEKVSLKKMGITGVFCGGTEMTPQFHRFAVEELLEGAYFAPTYGNTLMGLAVHKPRQPEDNYAIIYYPPVPRAVVEVIDPDEPDRVVGYGETGRVRLTTLTKEFFMPRFLERDEAEREPPCDLYPWDGVRNVRPFSRFQTSVVEGVY